MITIDKLVARAQTHKGFVDGTRNDVIRLRTDIDKKENNLNNLIEHHKDMQWCYQYLDSLIKADSNRFISKLESLLNDAMESIFNDYDYKIKIVTDDSKRAQIRLCYNEGEEQIESDIHLCGGGIRSVVGVVIQIFMLFHYGVEKILIADEAFSQISSEYLERVFSFLDILSTSNNLKILLVTHDSRVLEYASKQYVVEDGHAIEQLNRRGKIK